MKPLLNWPLLTMIAMSVSALSLIVLDIQSDGRPFLEHALISLQTPAPSSSAPESGLRRPLEPLQPWQAELVDRAMSMVATGMTRPDPFFRTNAVFTYDPAKLPPSYVPKIPGFASAAWKASGSSAARSTNREPRLWFDGWWGFTNTNDFAVSQSCGGNVAVFGITVDVCNISFVVTKTDDLLTVSWGASSQ